MDDPWANAWGEPLKTAPELQTVWTPSSDAIQESEADIGTPSWSTDSGVKWAEQSDTQPTLWDATLPSKEWSTSPYDSISLGKVSVDQVDQDDRSPSPEQVLSITASTLASPLQPVESNSPTSSECFTPQSPPDALPIPGSPDAFGTFETGVQNDDVDPWSQPSTAPKAALPDSETWGLEWDVGASELEAISNNEAIDEWEQAKRQKERQDRHVPPAVLASILDQFGGLSLEMWPNNKQTSGQDADIRNLQQGVDEIESPTFVMDKLVPQGLVLPPHVQFPKTFTSKNMGEALRLTRHVGATRSSPMALYLASKGSTAWETSVKSRPENLRDDLLPPGWRVLEKDKEEAPLVMDGKKKPTGGLLSFFGRRGETTSPSAATSSRPESPVRPSSRASIVPQTSNVMTTRASGDENPASPRPATPVIQIPPARLPITDNRVSLEIPSTAPAPSVQPSSQSNDASDAVPPTSAVSRFLNRFSRSKTTGSSPRNSLALSLNDLEFLSDIVPSANDEIYEASQLRELSSMIESSPLPTKLPPPLPPPPKLLPPNRVSTSLAEYAHHPITSTDNGLSLFNSLADKSEAFPINVQPPLAILTPKPEDTRRPLPRLNQMPLPSDFSPQTPASETHTLQRKIPQAIMSTFSGPSSNFTVDPLPFNPSNTIIPPPPSTASASVSQQIPNPPPLSWNEPAVSQESVTALNSISDDEFSEFHSYASIPFDSSVSSVFSDRNLISQSNASTSEGNNLFDDFDDFVSSPLHTPSPPPPPVKPFSLGHKTLQQQLSTPPPQSLPSSVRRVSRAADHQRTMSLLESAATRKGRWPAPPSPLPEILPPPPGDYKPATAYAYFSASSTVQDRQSGSLGPSMSSPAAFSDDETTPRIAALPPPNLHSSTLTTNTNHEQARSTNPLLLPTPPSSTTPGGLSAQDLSFFEGL